MKFINTIIICLFVSGFISGQTIYDKKPVLKPRIFAEGTISTDTHSEFDITFTNSGKTAYFTRRLAGEPQRIYYSDFADGKWSSPKIASFSTFREGSPLITPDGRTLYFASTRPIPGTVSRGIYDENIWKVEKTENGWSSPVPLTDKIDKIQTEGEEFPSSNESSLYTNDGENFYFSTQKRGSKGIDIYKTQLLAGEFSEPEKLSGEVNSEKYWESGGILSPDDRYIFLNIYGETEGFGLEDIYVSRRTETGWAKPVNLGKLINTEANEAAPRFSPDGKYFFFSREIKKAGEEDGIWSLYFVETKALALDRLFPLVKTVSKSEVTDGLTGVRLKSTNEIFSGNVVEYYDDGKLKKWREVKNGAAEGLWLEWLENGYLRYRAYWKDGKGDGLWQYFHDNGKLRSEGVYENDLPKGVHYFWHSNGQLKVKRIYLDGKETGEWMFYKPNGEIEKTETYLNGKKIVR